MGQVRGRQDDIRAGGDLRLEQSSRRRAIADVERLVPPR
jgi:hypothetical protein